MFQLVRPFVYSAAFFLTFNQSEQLVSIYEPDMVKSLVQETRLMFLVPPASSLIMEGTEDEFKNKQSSLVITGALRAGYYTYPCDCEPSYTIRFCTANTQRWSTLCVLRRCVRVI